ncbi:MAG: AAA family ATPase [Candidatus Binatia bacterium]
MATLEELTYRDYLRILRQRWRLPAAAAGLGLVAGLVLAKWQAPRPVYDGVSIVRFNPQSGFEASWGMVPPDQGKELVSQILLITSPAVLGRAAIRLGLVPSETPHDQVPQSAIGQLSAVSSVRPDPTGRTGLLRIHGYDVKPARAAEIANAVSEAYKEENLDSLKKYVVARRQFLEHEIKENDDARNRAQLAYEEYRREHPLAVLEPGTGIAEREAKQRELAGRIGEAKRQLDLVNAGRPISDLGLIAIVGARGTTRLTQLSTQYTTLQLDRARMLNSLTNEHPMVRSKTSQIASVRQGLADELNLIVEAFEIQQEEARKAAEQLRELEKTVPAEAMQLAHLQHQVKVHESLGHQLGAQLIDTMLKETSIIGQVTIMSAARPPRGPINAPPYGRLGALGLVGGLFAGLVIAVLMEMMRFSLADVRELESSTEVPVLGINPLVTPEALSSWLPERPRLKPGAKDWNRSLALVNLLAPRSPMSEAIRALRAGLQGSVDGGEKAFTVCGVNVGDGATTTAMNLALSFAQAGKRVLLVECDLRAARVSEILGLQREPGFSDLLLRTATLDRTTRNVADFVTGTLTLDQVLLAPGLDRFHVLPCGQRTTNVVELLGSGPFEAVLQEMKSAYDLIIFDAPPLSYAADAILLGRKTPVVLVFSPQRTSASKVQNAVTQLRKSECRIAGLFVNGMEAEPETEAAHASAA